MTSPLDKSEYFSLPDNLDRTELLRILMSEHNFVLDPQVKKKEEFLDTFDRRLYNSNLILIKERNSYSLKQLSDGEEIAEYTPNNDINPRFWWDLPNCSLRKELKPICGIRAILSLAKIERSISTLRLLNEDKKTVLFFYLKDLKALDSGEQNPILMAQIKEVRGYENEAHTFSSYLSGLDLMKRDGDILSAADSYPAKYPLDYSSKINVKLDPAMKSSEAAKLIFISLLKTMKANEFGIKEDIDTEFLHDFRVAVRRTRSALSQIKEVFSQEHTDFFKEKFSMIGKATNALRDLDVYLLTENSYKNMIPQDLRPGLDPLFKSLTVERENAKKECSIFLDSKEYKDIINAWEDFLNNHENNHEQATNSGKPIIELAKKHIWKKYSKVIKLGKKIGNSTPDTELHRLRIECKKLRYLLEFFSSLFPDEDIKAILKHLKKLQDNLGDFNDLHVQQESLKKFLKDANIGYDQSKQKTLSAAGGLISVLYQRQIKVRKKFKASFNEFGDNETSRVFENLFSGN